MRIRIRSTFVLPTLAVAALGALPLSAAASEQVPADQEVELEAAGAAQASDRAPSSQAVPLRTLDPQQVERQKAAAADASPAPDPLPATPRAAIFNGLNQPGLAAQDSTPPDSTGAIGPSVYIEMVNRQVAIYDRTNLAQIGPALSLATFTGQGTANVFDPQIQFDPVANRWFYVADSVASSSDNRLAFGFSRNANPADLTPASWCRYQISTGAVLDDYPKLGHNDTHALIGTNVFGASFQTARIWAVSKPPAGDLVTCPDPSSLTATSFGSAANPLVTADGQTAFTPVPANTFEGATNGYVVAADFPSGGSANQIMAWHVSGTPPVLTQDGNMDVATYAPPADVPQPGTSNVLDSLESRLTQAVADGDPQAGGAQAVWTQHTVNGAGGRSEVRWYELIPSSLTVRQAGTINDPAHFVFNAAISPTANGNQAVINYNTGSSTRLADLRAQSRNASTPLNQMADEVTLGSSVAAMQDFSCTDPTICRWGDYAGASPDPVNPAVVWGSNQLIGAASGPSPVWTTRNFALDIGDTVTPETTITGAPSGTINSRSPSISFGASEPSSFECRVDGGPFTSCSSPVTLSNLADGGHGFEVRAVDTAGNFDPTAAAALFSVDATAPETRIDSGPKKIKKGKDAKFTFSSEPGASFECRLDDKPFAACTSPHTERRPKKGRHTFEVRAKDAVGNTDPSAAAQNFKVKRKRRRR